MPPSAKKRRKLDDAPPVASSSDQVKTQQSTEREPWLPGIADPDESQGWSSEDPDSEEERVREGRRKSAWNAGYDKRVDAFLSGRTPQRPAVQTRRRGGTRIRDLKHFCSHSKLAVHFENADAAATAEATRMPEVVHVALDEFAHLGRRRIKLGRPLERLPAPTAHEDTAASTSALPAAAPAPAIAQGEAISRSLASAVALLANSAGAVAGPSTSTTSVASKGGRGRKATKVVDYDNLTKKKKAEYSTVALFADLLAQTRAVEGSKSKRQSLSSANLFSKCRVFYLLHPARNGKLEEEDRLRMRRIAQAGGTIESSLEVGVTTHVLTSHVRSSMGWDSSWKAVQAQLASQGQNDRETVARWRALLQGPVDGTAGTDVVWLIDQGWVVESLKANSDRPHPERYFRIESAAARRNTTGLSKASSSRIAAANSSVSLRQEPSQDFIGAKTNTFRERYGDEEGSTQNSAFHTSDYVSSTVSPAFAAKDISPEQPQHARNGKPLKRLPTSSAAPGHKALRYERQRQVDDQSDDEMIIDPSPDDVEIETSRIAEDGEQGQGGETGAKAAASVYQELSREIELAKLGEGQEEEELLLYNSDEGEPDTDELDSDEETKKKAPAPKKRKTKVRTPLSPLRRS